MSFGPSGPYLKLKFVVIFQPIRELEFRGRLSDFFLSPQFAIKDQVCIQLSLLCETMTYFTKKCVEIGFYLGINSAHMVSGALER